MPKSSCVAAWWELEVSAGKAHRFGCGVLLYSTLSHLATLLLLFAPVLQRAHNWIVKLVEKVKPLLNAFQVPKKIGSIGGHSLLIILFIALTANTKHDPLYL